ncbi:MAG: heme biosynthesis protein HemY [Paraglaciecola sp.]|nr:heme biosynthesis protein HemY [Paraglaciecola sp.]
MKSFIRICMIFVILLIMLVVSAMIFDDRGYVFIEFNGYAIEMNVMSLAISLILVFITLLLFNWIINLSFNATSTSRAWFGNFGSRKKQKAFRSGLLAMAENDYQQARNAFAKIENDDFDGINLLAAAQVELQLGEPQKAKVLWHKAAAISSSSLAANQCLLRDALQQGQPDNALELIANLPEKQRNQALIIKLWAQALAEAGKWQVLKDKLPSWKKSLGPDYDLMMQQASKGQFAEIASKEGGTKLIENWLASSRSVRKDPAQQAAYIQQLIDQGMHSEAEKALVEYQKSAPHALLIPLFKQIKLPNPNGALKKLEGWLKYDENNVELLSTLGHVAYHANDLILAEKVLSKAIKLGHKQEDLRLMATIKEAQQDNLQALALFKQSMAQPGA